jgi:acyl carrier protein
MNEEVIIQQLNIIFTDIIDEGDVSLTMSTTANDVSGWDSLNHVQILAAIEKKYKIRFTLPEIQKFMNVGDVVKAIQQKTIK